MTKFALICAAAGMLLAAPNFVAPASAAEGIKVAQVDVRIGSGPDRRYAGERRHHRHVRADRHCSKTVVIKNGRKTVIKRCR
jgi:hypothetical protein